MAVVHGEEQFGPPAGGNSIETQSAPADKLTNTTVEQRSAEFDQLSANDIYASNLVADVKVSNPITNNGSVVGLNYDDETLNLSSATGNPLQINLGRANTWTAVQTFPGVKTTAGVATTVTVGASPYTYTNSSASNQQIFVQGGTVSAISFNPNGGTGIALSGLTDNVITLRPNDTLTITYTAAPTVNTIQL